MMRVYWIGCAAALLLAAGTHVAPAQSTADAYFHEAAQQYVADDVQAARRTVEQGLSVAPSDPRLLALREKLRQGKRPRGEQDSSSTGSQKNEQEQSDQSSKEDSKGGQQPSSEQSGESQPGSRDSPSKQSGPRSSQQGSSDPSGRTDERRQGQGGRPVDTLSRAQAERLLNALEGQERRLLRQLRSRSSERQPVDKDW